MKNNTKNCEFGCGNDAKYKIGKLKRFCCSAHHNRCPKIRGQIFQTKYFGPNAERNKLAAIKSCQSRVRLKEGEIRHELQFISAIRKDNKIVKLECLCLACNTIKVIGRAKFGITKSCGCVTKNKKGERSSRFKGYKEFSGSKWRSYVWNAQKRNIPFSIKIEETWDKLVNQKFTCALSGQTIELKSRGGTASLDRIDNKKGYEITNIHWVHKKINQIKMDMPLNEFKELCKMVYIFNEKNHAID